MFADTVSGSSGSDLIEEIYSEYRFDPLWLSIQGSHLYGFASGTSDVDISGTYVRPLDETLTIHGALQPNYQGKFRTSDVTLYELGKFIRLLLQGNGNAAEVLHSPFILSSSPEREWLLSWFDGYLTSGHQRSYLGIAESHIQRFIKDNSLKSILHAFRAVLTGIHLFETGEYLMDLPELVYVYDAAYLNPLLSARQGDSGSLLDLSKSPLIMEKYTSHRSHLRVILC